MRICESIGTPSFFRPIARNGRAICRSFWRLALRNSAPLLLLLGSLVVAAPSQAVKFTISGGYSAQFDIASSAPIAANDPTFFRIDGVQGIYGSRSTPTASLSFFTGDVGGGLQIVDTVDNNSVLLDVGGLQLFTGPTSAPTFTLGSFTLTDFAGSGNYNLLVTASTSAVPEPAIWLSMMIGLAFVGAAMRHRRPAHLAVL